MRTFITLCLLTSGFFGGGCSSASTAHAKAEWTSTRPRPSHRAKQCLRDGTICDGFVACCSGVCDPYLHRCSTVAADCMPSEETPCELEVAGQTRVEH